jgi:hypothetical protein
MFFVVTMKPPLKKVRGHLFKKTGDAYGSIYIKSCIMFSYIEIRSSLPPYC